MLSTELSLAFCDMAAAPATSASLPIKFRKQAQLWTGPALGFESLLILGSAILCSLSWEDSCVNFLLWRRFNSDASSSLDSRKRKLLATNLHLLVRNNAKSGSMLTPWTG